MRNSLTFFSFLLTLGMAFAAMAQDASAPLHDPQVDFPGSPEKPLTRELLSRLSSLNESNQIFEAWKALAEQNDGYAESATRIFGNKITVEKCVVESNWDIVVGEEVFNRLYIPYAQLYQRHYIEFLKENRRYPNTLEIEKLYQRTDNELGLPQSVSVDLMMNLVPVDWRRRIFFDSFSNLIGVGRSAQPKLWFHYTEISDARVSSESITAQDINVDQAKQIYKKATGKVAKCMAKRLKASGNE